MTSEVKQNILTEINQSFITSVIASASLKNSSNIIKTCWMLLMCDNLMSKESSDPKLLYRICCLELI